VAWSVEEDLKKMGLRNWRRNRTEKVGGEFWKKLSFTEECNARKRRSRRRRGRRRRRDTAALTSLLVTLTAVWEV
jgi:hypothetical protein